MFVEVGGMVGGCVGGRSTLPEPADALKRVARVFYKSHVSDRASIENEVKDVLAVGVGRRRRRQGGGAGRWLDNGALPGRLASAIRWRFFRIARVGEGVWLRFDCRWLGLPSHRSLS